MGAGDTGSGGKKQRRVNHQPGHGAGQRQPWPLPSSPGGRRARVAPGTVLRQEDQVWGTLTLPWKASPHQGHPRELRSDTPPAGQRDRVGGWGGGQMAVEVPRRRPVGMTRAGSRRSVPGTLVTVWDSVSGLGTQTRQQAQGPLRPDRLPRGPPAPLHQAWSCTPSTACELTSCFLPLPYSALPVC